MTGYGVAHGVEAGPDAVKGPEVRHVDKLIGTTRRVGPGDVVEIRLVGGELLAYFQYVCPGWTGPVVRVLPGTYETPLDAEQLRQLVAGPSLFLTQHFIDQAWKESGARVVAQLPIPDAEAGLPPFRSAGEPADNPRSFVRLPDGTSVRNPQFAAEHPDVDFDALPLWAVPVWPTLSRMIETQWTPRQAVGPDRKLPPRPGRISSDATDRSQMRGQSAKSRPQTTYTVVLPSEDATHAAHRELRDGGFFAPYGHDDNLDEWFLEVRTSGPPDAALEAHIDEVARRHGGRYTGNLVGPL